MIKQTNTPYGTKWSRLSHWDRGSNHVIERAARLHASPSVWHEITLFLVVVIVSNRLQVGYIYSPLIFQGFFFLEKITNFDYLLLLFFCSAVVKTKL